MRISAPVRCVYKSLTSDCAFPVVIKLVLDETQHEAGQVYIQYYSVIVQDGMAYLDFPTADSPGTINQNA
jgi:hypothetical protein